MNILRDNKGAAFYSLTRGERVYLMMKHSFEIQRSPFRKLKQKAPVEEKNVVQTKYGENPSALYDIDKSSP